MKKILALMLCIIMVCAMPLVVFAEGEESAPVEEETDVTEDATVEETPPEDENLPSETPPEEDVPTTEESVPEENIPEEVVPEENVPSENAPEADKPNIKETAKTITEKIESWVIKEKELLIALATIVAAVLYRLRDNKRLNKSIGTLNNNAVTIAESSSEAIKGASGAVTGYSAEISALLAEYRKTAEDNKKLEAALSKLECYLINAKKANIELSNEVAELLVLANIPNSKKDELYARHRAAIEAIAEIVEVKENDREEA